MPSQKNAMVTDGTMLPTRVNRSEIALKLIDGRRIAMVSFRPVSSRAPTRLGSVAKANYAILAYNPRQMRQSLRIIDYWDNGVIGAEFHKIWIAAGHSAIRMSYK